MNRPTEGYSLKEAARLLGVTDTTVRRMIKRKELSAWKVHTANGEEYRIDTGDVDRRATTITPAEEARELLPLDRMAAARELADRLTVAQAPYFNELKDLVMTALLGSPEKSMEISELTRRVEELARENERLQAALRGAEEALKKKPRLREVFFGRALSTAEKEDAR